MFFDQDLTFKRFWIVFQASAVDHVGPGKTNRSGFWFSRTARYEERVTFQFRCRRAVLIVGKGWNALRDMRGNNNNSVILYALEVLVLFTGIRSMTWLL
jgi:hypothetical protein